MWKRARAFILLDGGYDAKTICEILDIGPTVLTEWKFAFACAGLSFFGLKDYSQRQGHLFAAQETALALRLCGRLSPKPQPLLLEFSTRIPRVSNG